MITPIELLRENKIFNLNKIEKELGMPQGHLSRAINNKRALPKEWEAALKKYLSSKAETIINKLS